MIVELHLVEIRGLREERDGLADRTGASPFLCAGRVTAWARAFAPRPATLTRGDAATAAAAGRAALT